MKIICRCCGRDLNEIWQDNMSTNEQPLCEECYSKQNENQEVKPFYDEEFHAWCPNDCSLCGGSCIYDSKKI